MMVRVKQAPDMRLQQMQWQRFCWGSVSAGLGGWLRVYSGHLRPRAARVLYLIEPQAHSPVNGLLSAEAIAMSLDWCLVCSRRIFGGLWGRSGPRLSDAKRNF